MDATENLGPQAQALATELCDWLAEKNPPDNIGMAALAMTLAASAKAKGMTPHEAISRFTTSVRSVYKTMERWPGADSHH